MGKFSEIWVAPYGGRTLMLVVFNIFQTIGFYGFGNWVPALMASKGANVTNSLQYSAIIAVIYPIGPLLCALIADRFEAQVANRQRRNRHGYVRPAFCAANDYRIADRFWNVHHAFQ